MVNMNFLKTTLIGFALFGACSILNGQVLQEGNLLVFFQSPTQAEVILDYTIHEYNKNVLTLNYANKSSEIIPTSLAINNRGQDLRQIFRNGLFSMEIEPNLLANNDSTLVISVTYKVDFGSKDMYLPVLFPNIKPAKASKNLFNVEVVPTTSDLVIYPLFPKINAERGEENNFKFSMQAVPSFLRFTMDPSSGRIMGVVDILILTLVIALLIAFIYYIKSK